MRGDSGFTLIEVLVALVILGIGASTLLVAAQSHVSRVGDIRDRTIARWVAEDRLAALRLDVARPADVRMMESDWRVTTTMEPTGDPELARADIAVARVDDRDPLYRLTGFIDTGERAE